MRRVHTASTTFAALIILAALAVSLSMNAAIASADTDISAQARAGRTEQRPAPDLCQRFATSPRRLPPSCVPPPPVDACPNVPGNQASGPCADQQCVEQGGTWNGTSCVMPQGSVELIIVSIPFNIRPDNELWADFILNVKDEAVLLNAPIRFTVTTTGMDQTSGFTNLRLLRNGGQAGGPIDIALSNGVATFTFSDSILLPVGEHRFNIRGSIPTAEQSSVPNGATITFSAKPATDWAATGQSSGSNIFFEFIPEVSFGTSTILRVSGGGGGGGGPASALTPGSGTVIITNEQLERHRQE